MLPSEYVSDMSTILANHKRPCGSLVDCHCSLPAASWTHGYLERSISLLCLEVCQILQKRHLLQLPRRCTTAATTSDRRRFVSANRPHAKLRWLLWLFGLPWPNTARLCSGNLSIFSTFWPMPIPFGGNLVPAIHFFRRATCGQRTECLLFLYLLLAVRTSTPDGFLQVLRL